MAQATGTFQVLSGGEDAYHEREGEVRLTRAYGDQRFSGDIDGNGSVQWLSCYFPQGGARLVGLQRIEGSLGGRRGSFVVEALSDHDGKTSKGSWTILAGSGTGELSGIRGSGGFEAPGARRSTTTSTTRSTDGDPLPAAGPQEPGWLTPRHECPRWR